MLLSTNRLFVLLAFCTSLSAEPLTVDVRFANPFYLHIFNTPLTSPRRASKRIQLDTCAAVRVAEVPAGRALSTNANASATLNAAAPGKACQLQN
jgi:hypothetical protein